MTGNIDYAIRLFRSNLIDLANSRENLITEEIIAEVKGILSALDSLKLDNMFLAESSELRNQTAPEAIQNFQSGLAQVIADGDAMLYDLRNNLGKKNVQNLQENEIRNINYSAKEKLRDFVHRIHPYSFKSYQRLENYTNDLGIRNRFKSIRNEIDNKNQDKLKAWTNHNDNILIEAPKFNTPNWREHNFGLTHHNTNTERYENKASVTNKNALGSYYSDTVKYNFPIFKKQDTRLTESQIENMPPTINKQPKINTSMSVYSLPRFFENTDLESSNWKKHAIEAGINIEFPGTTEHKSKFVRPKKSHYRNFVVNPQPDMSRFQRPFTTAATYAIRTEYSHRYKFPDANSIDKFPWIKQF